MSIELDNLRSKYGDLLGRELLENFIKDYKGKIVMLCAFNPEDVILAKWISEIDSSLPILFLDTGKHFPETLRYANSIIEQLGLKGVETLTPRQDLINNIDKGGILWQTQVNRCCWLRKVEPIERAIEDGDYKVLITGRRIEQTPERSDMQNIEIDDNGRIKINPLLHQTKDERDNMMHEFGLAHHPLYDLGYFSIGCAPCTTPIFAGEDERAGRWRHTKLQNNDGGKTECGLHVQQDAN